MRARGLASRGLEIDYANGSFGSSIGRRDNHNQEIRASLRMREDFVEEIVLDTMAQRRGK